MDVFTVLDILYYSTFGFSLILNIILIILIVYRTNSHLKPYSRILLQGVILDIFMSIFLAFVPFHFESVKGYLFIGNGVPWLSYFHGYFQCVWWVPHAIFPVVTSFSSTIQSFYRYSNFCLNKTLTPKPSAFIYGFIFFGMFAGTCVLSTTFVYLYDDPDALSVLSTLPFWVQHQQHLKLFCVGKLLHFSTLIYLSTVSLVTMFSVAVLIWFNIRVAAYLAEAKTRMHSKTIRLQRQITWQLNIQSVLPSLCSLQTFVLIFVIVFTPNYSGGLFMFLYCPYAIIPVVNPLTALLCISQYRRELFHIVGLTRFQFSSDIVRFSTKKSDVLTGQNQKGSTVTPKLSELAGITK